MRPTVKFYVMYSLVTNEVLGRFRVDEHRNEQVYVDGAWADADGYVTQCLIEGRPNFVEVASHDV